MQFCTQIGLFISALREAAAPWSGRTCQWFRPAPHEPICALHLKNLVLCARLQGQCHPHLDVVTIRVSCLPSGIEIGICKCVKCQYGMEEQSGRNQKHIHSKRSWRPKRPVGPGLLRTTPISNPASKHSWIWFRVTGVLRRIVPASSSHAST